MLTLYAKKLSKSFFMFVFKTKLLLIFLVSFPAHYSQEGVSHLNMAIKEPHLIPGLCYKTLKGAYLHLAFEHNSSKPNTVLCHIVKKKVWCTEIIGIFVKNVFGIRCILYRQYLSIDVWLWLMEYGFEKIHLGLMVFLANIGIAVFKT